MMNAAFGTPKHDLDVLHLHVPEQLHNSSVKDDGRRVISEMNKKLNGDLSGENLAEMMEVFTKTLKGNLDREFPTDPASASAAHQATDDGWVTLDFCDFAKRHFTLAAIPSMYGSHLLELWPQAYEDIWSFDDDLKLLMKHMPKFLIRGIYNKREKMLNTIVQWEKNAMKNRDIGKLTEENPPWDEHWGARLIRNRHNILVKNGISETGRAAQYLALIYGSVDISFLFFFFFFCARIPAANNRPTIGDRLVKI